MASEIQNEILNDYIAMLNRNANAFVEGYPEYKQMIVDYHRLYAGYMEKTTKIGQIAQCEALLNAFDEEIDSSIKHIREVQNG